MKPPHIISITPQPTTGAEPTKAEVNGLIPPPRKPAYFPQQADYYRFYSPTTGRACYLLRGDTAPVVTGGYAKWNVVDRPRRTGVTTFAGYDPITMDVPVRFEAYLGEQTGYDVEQDVQTLEFFAGRGVGAANSQKDKTPPYIAIAAFDSAGRTIHVLGNNYTFDEDINPTVMRWVVGPIQWDGDVLFNSLGRKIRQTATVTLTQFVDLGALGSKSKSHKRKVVTHHATAKLNTMAKLSQAWGNTKHEVRELNKTAKTRPYVRDFTKRIPAGTAFKFYVK